VQTAAIKQKTSLFYCSFLADVWTHYNKTVLF